MSHPTDSSTASVASHAWRWRILAVVLLADVMDLLDSTVMNVAAPSVRAGLGGGEVTLQWLTAGYTLAFGVLLVVGARLGDRWGRRRLFLVGAVGFTVASAACGFAGSPATLIAARVAQGAFGALMIPQGFGVLTTVFPDGRERGRAFSLFGPVMGLAAVGGPILAGGLIALDLGGLDWRLIFLINLPLGALAVAGALAWMPDDRGDRAIRIDPVGAALVALGSGLVVYPLIQGREAGWPWWTFAALAGGVIAFAALAVRQRTSASPILAPTLLRKRPFVAGLGVAVVFFAGIGGFLLVLSLFLQLSLHYTPLQAGLALAPVALGIAASSVAAPALGVRLGRRLLHVGLGVELLGALAFAAVAATGAPGPAFAGAALVLGSGLGLLFGSLIQTILAAAAPDEVGSASGALNAVQQLAGALGVAVLGTVFFGADAGAAGLIAGAVIVAASCVLCAALVLLLPRSPADERTAL